jgi:hypothetical protein
MSEAVDLPFPTTDASRWAAEFVRLHGGDEALMLGWFANAIEHGRGPDAARVAPSDGLREAMDSLGPVTFGPGCAPFDHPLGCQCPYPVAAAERDRLAALATTGQPEHRLLMPPHPDGAYQSSAQCSCGGWQYDQSSAHHLAADYQAVLFAHTQHAQPEDTRTADPGGLRRASVVAEMEAEGVVSWGDTGHRARFLALTPEAKAPDARE